MADFVKKDWKCGDTITADELNRLENGVEEALDGGSVDCGYSCGEEWVTLTDESVTTAEQFGSNGARFVYSELINADTIRVTFNNQEYVCERSSVPMGQNVYGAPAPTSQDDPVDWSEYPFIIFSGVGLDGSILNTISTQTAGTYQVKIEGFSLSATTTPCFNKAVHSVIDADIKLSQPMIISNTRLSVGGGTIDAKFADICDAFCSGRSVIVVKPMDNSAFEIVSVAKNANGGGTVIGGDGHTYTASADDAYPSYSQGSGGGTTT